MDQQFLHHSQFTHHPPVVHHRSGLSRWLLRCTCDGMGELGWEQPSSRPQGKAGGACQRAQERGAGPVCRHENLQLLHQVRFPVLHSGAQSSQQTHTLSAPRCLGLGWGWGASVQPSSVQALKHAGQYGLEGVMWCWYMHGELMPIMMLQCLHFCRLSACLCTVPILKCHDASCYSPSRAWEDMVLMTGKVSLPRLQCCGVSTHAHLLGMCTGATCNDRAHEYRSSQLRHEYQEHAKLLWYGALEVAMQTSTPG